MTAAPPRPGTVSLPAPGEGEHHIGQGLHALGKQSAPAYRAFLYLACEWDRYGGHNGRLVRPTRPEVLRDPADAAQPRNNRVCVNEGLLDTNSVVETYTYSNSYLPVVGESAAVRLRDAGKMTGLERNPPGGVGFLKVRTFETDWILALRQCCRAFRPGIQPARPP